MNNKEVLFWKIFRNKFLRFKILGSIKLISNEYQNIEDYKIGNRIGFSDIRSIDFLILKNQLPLLNDKLNSNSVINWGPNSIKILIQKCHDPILFNKIYQLNKHQIKYKANLISHAVRFENIVALELFLQDGSNHYTILPSTLSDAVKYSSPLILSKLLQCLVNRNLSIFDYIDKHSIILDALLNKNYLDEMISFILDFQSPHEIYLPVPRPIPNFTMISTYSLKLRLVKSFSNQFYLDSPNYKVLSNVEQCLSYLQLFYIKKSINYIPILDELDKQRNGDGNLYIKLLRSIIFKETGSNEFYNSFIEEYDCVIGDHQHTKRQLSLVHNYTFTSFSCNTLKFLLSQNYDGSNDIYIGRVFDANKKFSLENQNRIIQFFKLYYQNDNFNIVKVNKWYEIIKFIVLNCPISTLESIKEIKSFPMDHFLLVGHLEIMDPIKYDWYLKSILFSHHNQDNITTQFNSNISDIYENEKFNPHSLELLKFIESKLSIKLGPQEYFHLFNYSLLNCDIETCKFTIDQLESSGSNGLSNSLPKHRHDCKLDLLFKSDDITKIQLLFNYLNSTGFSKFTDKMFSSLIDKLSKSKLPSQQLQLIPIDFGLFKFETFKILIDCIVNLELDNVNLIINNQIPFIMDTTNDISFKNQVDETIKRTIDTQNYAVGYTSFRVYKGYKIDVYKMIQLLISNSQMISNSFSPIFNYLINIFLQCSDTTLQDIHNLYCQLKQLSIPISNDQIYLIYYFTSKSTKFLKFFNNILRITGYYANPEKSFTDTLSLLLPTSIFTFDFVYNSSFKSLFLKLYNHLNQFQNIDINRNNIIKNEVGDTKSVDIKRIIEIFNYLMSIDQVDLILDIIYDTNLDKEESIKIISEIIKRLISIISIDQFESLYQNGLISIESSLSNAIECSNFTIIKYILSNGYYTNSTLPDCSTIYKNCENDLIIYLYSNFKQLITEDQATQCFNISFSLGNLEITQFLISIYGIDKFKLTCKFIQDTFEVGYSNIVKFYYEKDFVGITFDDGDILKFISLKISYLPWVKKNI